MLKTVCAAIALSAFLYACGFSPGESSLAVRGTAVTALNRGALEAKITNPEEGRYLFFAFNEEQKAYFAALQESRGAALEAELSFGGKGQDAPQAGAFAFGFLYRADIGEGGEVSAPDPDRSTVRGDLAESPAARITVALSAAPGEATPAGFFVYGEAPVRVTRADIVDAAIGWEKSGVDGAPRFAFGPAGGRVTRDFSSCDFSGAGELFPAQSPAGRPYVEIAVAAQEDIGTYDNQRRIRLRTAGEALAIRLSKHDAVKVLQTSAFASPLDEVRITEGADLVSSIMMKAPRTEGARASDGRVLTPLKTDLGLIISWPRTSWRCASYELFEWELFPGVLFFDFADYRTQNQFLTRLAYFVEKAGYKGTLVSDDFVEHRHGYNAHDYKAEDLAAFFTRAEQTAFPLNDSELLLRDILVENGIIARTEGGYDAGRGAIVSISRESPDYLRRQLLAHESWHGIYFTDEAFRNVVAACYGMFDGGSMQFLKTYWRTQPGLEYDTNDEYLMQNEFMAYIMQQSVANCAPYFLRIADRASVNAIQPGDADYIRRTGAAAFEDASRVLNDYAFETWGLACGRVALVQRE